MPDEIIEEEITEHEGLEEDPEAEAAFDSDDEITESDKTEKDEPEKDESDKDKKDTDETEKEPEKDDKKSGEDDKKPDEDDEPSLEDQLKKRAKDLGLEDEEETEDPDKDKKKDPPPSPGSSLTKEQIADHLSGIKEEGLPGEVIIGDRTIDLKKFRNEDPEAFDSMVVMAGVIASSQIAKFKEESAKVETVSVEDFNKQARLVDDLLFWNKVGRKHRDWEDVINSDEFAETIKAQPKGIQKLAKNLATVDDAIMIIDLHKKRIGKENTDKHDKDKGDKKKKSDDLHLDTTDKDTSKPPASSKKEQKGADEEAFDSDEGD